MAWGEQTHEAFEDERRERTGWSGGTFRSGDGDVLESRAACSCGWRSETIYPSPPRPAGRYDINGPKPEGWDAWIAEIEAIHDRVMADWDGEHLAELIDDDPNTHLVLARDGGGQRHFLAGRPVHAGAGLEVKLRDGTWMRVRYEWSWDPRARPTATFTLGAPAGAEEIGRFGPEAEFRLDPAAILRWPEQSRW